MKTIEIIGFKRANLTKSELSKLRAEGNVPCVLYGNGLNITFHSPAILFRDLVYTSDAAFVELNIEGSIFKAIKQELQFHPVNDSLTHVDFLIIQDDKKIKMPIPVALKGTAAGVLKGGRLAQRLSHVVVEAFPKDMPTTIDLDITHLELGKSVRVSEIKLETYIILNTPAVPIVSVEITRALRQATAVK